MATSYHGAILDHLAECMLYLSTASSFWFSLNSAHGSLMVVVAVAVAVAVTVAVTVARMRAAVMAKARAGR